MNLTNQAPHQKGQTHKKHSRAERESQWYRYGSDADYQAWCRKRPSACSGQTANVVYAHYRTAKNSGTGVKPVFSGIPLTYKEHQLQHRIGQYNFMTRERWEYLVDMHLKLWVESCKNKP